MFTALLSDWNNLTSKQFSAKYILPVVVLIFGLLFMGQVIVQFLSVGQLYKVQGRLVNMETKITSYTHHRGQRGSTPDYSLILTLDNSHSYYIQYIPLMHKLDTALHVNDNITLYCSTKLIKAISLNLIADAPQIEQGNKVLFSFDEEKHRALVLVAVFGMMTAAFGLMMYFWRQ